MDFSAIFTSVKAGLDIIQTLQKSKINAEVEAKTQTLNQIILEIQRYLYEAQKENMQLQAHIQQLQSQINQQWADEQQNYAPYQYPTGSIVYRPKQGIQYDLCANCFLQGRKTLLQANSVYCDITCRVCGDTILTDSVSLATY